MENGSLRPSISALGADDGAARRPPPRQPQKGDPMSPIPLRIVLHGLIALTPANGADSANHMTALLVDAHTRPAEVDARCFAPHVPMLEVATSTTEECEAVPGCGIQSGTCHCTLSRQDLSLEVTPSLQL